MARPEDQEAPSSSHQQPNGNQFPGPNGNQFPGPNANNFQSSPHQQPHGTQIPATNSYPVQVGDPWSTGLFDCQQDQTNCIMTVMFPCMTFGQIAEVLDEGQTSCALGAFIYTLMMPALFSNWIMGSKYRTKLRQKYNLVQAPYEDAISHILCPCCSLSQEFRELKMRGLDPNLGWNGIVAQQQLRMRQHYSDQGTYPPPHQSMS